MSKPWRIALAVVALLGMVWTGALIVRGQTGAPAPLPEFSAYDVAAGSVPGHEIWTALGERESMGTTATGEDVWRGNELSPAPTSHVLIPTPDSAGEQMTVVSESANDAAGGTGIRTLRLHYLDAAGDEQVEDVTMNGTTGVNTVATNIRFLNDMHALTVGSLGVAADHVKIYKTGTVGAVYNMIAGGGNKSLVPHRMVPRAKKLVLVGWHAEEAQGKRCAFRIRSTDCCGALVEGVFIFKGVAYTNKTTSGELRLTVPIPALSIVKVSAWPDASGAEGSVGWWGILGPE